MLPVTLLSLALAGGALAPHTDYSEAYREALRDKKDLVIHFRTDNRLDAILAHPEVRNRLYRSAFLQVPANYAYKGKRLLDHGAFAEMGGHGGLAVLSLYDAALPAHGQVISAHPFVPSRYNWVPAYGFEEVRAILDLPATASLTQRSMIYAIRVHPERPQSVYGVPHRAFLGHAHRHSLRQASMRNQHLADLIGTSYLLQSQSGCSVGSASEVVAESWGAVVGGENVLEAAFSCVDAWRHSSGHWSAVSRPHRFFGYDVARSGSGTWYATGIFAD
jgi:hypothetical protein